MEIIITDHFRNRFKQRVANTNRINVFVEKAMNLGRDTKELSSVPLANTLMMRENEYGSSAKVYKNCVYWFCDNRAITVYPLSQKDHERSNNE